MTTHFPEATPHGPIQRVFEDVFTVTGSVMMRPGIQLSRNMTIIREGKELTLISAVRLNEKGLKELDALGEVKHVLKLGDYHLGEHNGLDDAFYLDRYNARLWAMPGMTHLHHQSATDELQTDGPLPFSNASFFSYESSRLPEGLILLHKEGGVVIAADSLQNWATTDAFFNEKGAQMMQKIGFIRPANIGPEWRRKCEPKAEDFTKVKALAFRHLLPSHGMPLLHTAKEQISQTIAELYQV